MSRGSLVLNYLFIIIPFAICLYPLLAFVPPELYFPNLLYFCRASISILPSFQGIHLNGVL